MIIPHFHASIPTGVAFSKQASLSRFLLAWLISCGVWDSCLAANALLSCWAWGTGKER